MTRTQFIGGVACLAAVQVITGMLVGTCVTSTVNESLRRSNPGRRPAAPDDGRIGGRG